MRLINKITLWYLFITAAVLLAGGIFVFNFVRHEMMEEEERRLKDLISFTADSLQKGASAEQLNNNYVKVQKIPGALPLQPLRVTDTLVWFPPHRHYEAELIAMASYKINTDHFLITARTFISEPDDIQRAVKSSLIWTFITLLVLCWVFSRFISRKILTPFYKTLQSLQSFSLTRQTGLNLQTSSTTEFKELNNFLAGMTAKAIRDYQSLKEFTENASHELQTPLAVIRGKLELLMESELNEEKAAHIAAAYNAIQNLAAINQSLLLLTKLANEEYATTLVNFSGIVKDKLEDFDELAQIKSITLKKTIQEGVMLRLNDSLANILVTNLISNAIRHNYEDGTVVVELSVKQFKISNTGPSPQMPVEELFRRFKKSNQSGESVGLGLAIVKQICTLNNYEIKYVYENELHIITINF